jgi:hypothetical protein
MPSDYVFTFPVAFHLINEGGNVAKAINLVNKNWLEHAKKNVKSVK